jgi:WD40 repeat protein
MRRPKPKKLPQSFELEYSPSGKFIVALGRRVARWDSESHKVRFRCHPLKHPSSCAVHPSETSVLVKSTSGQIVLISAEDGELLRELGGKERGEGSNIVFSPCGDFVIDASWGGDFIVRSTATGSVEFEHKTPGDLIRQVVPMPGSNQWLTLQSPRLTKSDEACAPDYLNCWAWPFTKPTGVLRLTSDIRHLVPSPDGRLICAVGHESVALFGSADGVLMGTAAHLHGGTGVSAAWSPDGTEIGLVGRHVVAFYSAPALRELRSIPLSYPSDIKYSPDGASIALGSWGSGLLITRDEISQVH